MWCPDCQQQVAVRLKPGESVVRCAQCRARFSPPKAARRFDAATEVAPPLSFNLQRAVDGVQGAQASRCPISPTASWLVEEDLRHIARMSAGAVRGADRRTQWLDEQLQVRSQAELPASSPEHSAAEPREASVAADCESPSQPATRLDQPSAPHIELRPITDQVRAASRPSPVQRVLAEMSNLLGGLALVNGLALSAWSRFGGRPDWLAIGVPVSLAGVGLLFLSRIIAPDNHAVAVSANSSDSCSTAATSRRAPK